jgi:hypothetical protein
LIRHTWIAHAVNVVGKIVNICYDPNQAGVKGVMITAERYKDIRL